MTIRLWIDGHFYTGGRGRIDLPRMGEPSPARQAYDLDGAATVVDTGETALGHRTVTVERQHVLPPQIEVLEIGTAAGTDFERFAAETKRLLEAETGLPPSVLRGDEP